MAHVITHREFKLLLDASNFPTKHSVVRFNDTLAEIASSLHVRFDQFDSIDSQIRQVRFFDTADESLRKNNVILRIRQDQSTGWPDETWEVTLKRRSHDYQVASDFNVGHSLQLRERLKFKEEIVRDADPGTSRRIFSNNNVFESPLHNFSAPVSRIVEIFPGLATLNLDPNATIEAVNKARVFEVQARLGILNFGKDAAAHLDLAVWMRPTSDAFNVLIAELAFAYKVAGTTERHQEGHEAADRFFVDMQTPLREKLATGTTKTALIYGVDER
ncbi:MAG TPA: hypothetical protein VGF18_10340 [Candidatus Tumulicola sp.]|jgi:hypothetical protein